MAEGPEDLTLRYLRRIPAEQDKQGQRLIEAIERLGRLERGIAGLHGGIASLSRRIGRTNLRLDRVERRAPRHRRRAAAGLTQEAAGEGFLTRAAPGTPPPRRGRCR
jgi:hypothetical protein